MADLQWRTSDGISNSPFRTRGAFNPSATNNAANSNLPLAGDITIVVGDAIVLYDSFVVTSAYTFGGGTLSAGPLVLAPGDRLVYVGGDLTAPSSWISVQDSLLYGPNVRIISEQYPAFS